MTPSQFQDMMLKKQAEISEFIRKIAPRLIGKMAVDHFQDNFRKGGFDNRKWKAPKRMVENGQYAFQKYGPLLSERNELMNSITYHAGDAKVIISSDKVYARIHNEGGIIDIPVTQKMRKFAWAKHMEETEKTGDKKAKTKWKGLALTKKEKLTVKMPKRQFIGNSSVLQKKIEQMLQKEMYAILKK